MNLDEIQALWDEDSKLDQDELHVESTKIPSLHAKYYKIYNNLTLLKKVEEIKLKQTKKEKTKSEQVTFQQFQEKCWAGYEKKGMKTMFGKRYPNCVKKKK